MYDQALLGILQHVGNVDDFLRVLFGFLYRKTDFYRLLLRPGDRLGFPPGAAQAMALQVPGLRSPPSVPVPRARRRVPVGVGARSAPWARPQAGVWRQSVAPASSRVSPGEASPPARCWWLGLGTQLLMLQDGESCVFSLQVHFVCPKQAVLAQNAVIPTYHCSPSSAPAEGAHSCPGGLLTVCPNRWHC